MNIETDTDLISMQNQPLDTNAVSQSVEYRKSKKSHVDIKICFTVGGKDSPIRSENTRKLNTMEGVGHLLPSDRQYWILLSFLVGKITKQWNYLLLLLQHVNKKSYQLQWAQN